MSARRQAEILRARHELVEGRLSAPPQRASTRHWATRMRRISSNCWLDQI